MGGYALGDEAMYFRKGSYGLGDEAMSNAVVEMWELHDGLASDKMSELV